MTAKTIPPVASQFTSLFTALVPVMTSVLTGRVLQSFIVWGIMPIGAVGVGIAAASGAYFTHRRFNCRPAKSMLFYSMPWR
jgi:hypothetical protein